MAGKAFLVVVLVAAVSQLASAGEAWKLPQFRAMKTVAMPTKGAVSERSEIILESIAEAGPFSKFVNFVKLLELSGRLDVMNGTVLVPTDDAFSLANDAIQKILSDTSDASYTTQLDKLLSSHFLRDRLTQSAMQALRAAPVTRRFHRTGPATVMSTATAFSDIAVSVVSDGADQGFCMGAADAENVALATLPDLYVDHRLSVQGVDRVLLPRTEAAMDLVRRQLLPLDVSPLLTASVKAGRVADPPKAAKPPPPSPPPPPPPSPPPPPPISNYLPLFVKSVGKNVDGGVIANIKVASAASINLGCAKLCFENPLCVLFTFNLKLLRCYLKSSSPVLKSLVGTDTYVKIVPPPPPSPPPPSPPPPFVTPPPPSPPPPRSTDRFNIPLVGYTVESDVSGGIIRSTGKCRNQAQISSRFAFTMAAGNKCTLKGSQLSDPPVPLLSLKKAEGTVTYASIPGMKQVFDRQEGINWGLGRYVFRKNNTLFGCYKRCFMDPDCDMFYAYKVEPYGTPDAWSACKFYATAYTDDSQIPVAPYKGISYLKIFSS